MDLSLRFCLFHIRKAFSRLGKLAVKSKLNGPYSRTPCLSDCVLERNAIKNVDAGVEKLLVKEQCSISKGGIIYVYTRRMSYVFTP